MQTELTLPEKLLLLSLNKQGNIKQTMTGYKSFIEGYLNGAIIIDLIIKNKILIEDQYLVLKDKSLTKIDYYDYIINKINSSAKPIKLKHLISKSISWGSKNMYNMVANTLSNEKLVTKVNTKFLFIFNKTLFVPNLKIADQIIQQIRAEILEEGQIDPTTSSLVLLLDQSRLLKPYFSDYEREDLNKRINSIKMDNSKQSNEIILIMHIIKQVIDAINTAAIIVATTSSH